MRKSTTPHHLKIRPVGDGIPPHSLLWRYFDFQKFLTLVMEKSLLFVRMDKMEDTNEGISLDQLLVKYGDETLQRGAPNKIPNSKKTNSKLSKDKKTKDKRTKDKARRDEVNHELFKQQQSYFLSCWLIHDRESVAMWNSYSTIDGMAIRIDADSLIDAVVKHGRLDPGDKAWKLYYGLVDYQDFLSGEDGMPAGDSAEIFGFRKDLSFEHEHEFRFLLKAGKRSAGEDELVNLKLNNFSRLKFDLIFHPKMEEWKKRNIRNVLRRLGVENFRCLDSELDLRSEKFTTEARRHRGNL
jgi:hypothetical protein